MEIFIVELRYADGHTCRAAATEQKAKAIAQEARDMCEDEKPLTQPEIVIYPLPLE